MNRGKSSGTNWVISLRPYHADRIYRGVKTWEFRRTYASIPVGARVYIYESGTGHITGEFEVAEKHHGEGWLLPAFEENEQSQRDADEYLADAERATALRIKKPIKYTAPGELWMFGLKRPPQSYCRTNIHDVHAPL